MQGAKELVSTRVVIPFENYDGKLIVARRVPESRHYPRLWELPGGTVDQDESPEASARREALEETGIDLRLGKAALALLAEHRGFCMDEPTVPYIVYAYQAEPTPTIQAEVRLNKEEHTEFKLITPNNSAGLELTPDTEFSLQHYQKELGKAGCQLSSGR